MASITINSVGAKGDYSTASVETQDAILKRQAAIIVPEQEKNARSLLNEKGMSVGITSQSIRAKSPTTQDGVRCLTITFVGTRPNGNGTKRTAEVAFINEYGIAGRMSARNFIAKANEAKADECAAAAADIFAQYVSELTTF
ncbi:MAG: hypothetical protein ABFC31_07120 [Clostridiaceae bacterium]